MAPVLPGGNEGIGLAPRLQVEPDHQRRLRLAADRGQRLVTHADDVARGDDVHAGAVEVRMELEFRFDDVGLADELNPERGRKIAESQAETFDLDPGSVVAPHRIQRDPDHSVVPDLDALLPGVEAAGLADPVRQLG